MPHPLPATTGLPGLDAVLSGIEPGDSLVWEVDTIADYQEFVAPYAAAAAAAAHAAAARIKVLATCADIVREHYPKPPELPGEK